MRSSHWFGTFLATAVYGLLFRLVLMRFPAEGVHRLAFALLRRAPLGLLLLVSTVTIGAAYLGMAAAPTLALACMAFNLRRWRVLAPGGLRPFPA